MRSPKINSVSLREPICPNYGGECVTGLIPALFEGMPTPDWLSPRLFQARCVVLLVLDGLGWNQLQSRRELTPTLSTLDGRAITTVAPSTTSTALTSITTGRPPGEHGVVGYRVALQGGVLNTLRWSMGAEFGVSAPDPHTFQPCSVFGAQRPPVVTRAEHVDSGFSLAHLTDARLVGYRERSELVEAVVDAAGSSEALIYAYWDAIDRTAHEYGLGEQYNEELTACDSMIALILEKLPPDTALIITADHGQVEVGNRMLKLPLELNALVDRQSGEARFRWLHGLSGTGPEILSLSIDAFAEVAWVVGVDEAIENGWFGPVVTPTARSRLGDVALVAREPVGFADPAEEFPIQLLCRHGSLTSEEMLVPLLSVVT